MTDNAEQKSPLKVLIEAAKRNDLEAARDALARGAGVHEDYNGIDALSRAARYGHTDFVRLLIDNGADVNHKNEAGSAALIGAAYKGHIETAQLLIDRGADLEIRNKSGATALIASSQNNNNTEIVRFLIENGANINAQDGNGETALYKAADFGNRNMVRLLVDMGADPEIETCDGRSAADTRFHDAAEMVEEAIERKKMRARKAAAFAKAATAEKKRHNAVASKQESLRTREPKRQLKAGP